MNEENLKNNEERYVIDLDALPKPELTGHLWRQEGTQLICQSCSFTHMTFIEPGYQLYGFDQDGSPLIREIIVKPPSGL